MTTDERQMYKNFEGNLNKTRVKDVPKSVQSNYVPSIYSKTSNKIA